MTLDLANAIIIDTETTGVDLETSEIIETGLVMYGPETGWFVVEDQLYKPAAPIPPDASAIHDITDEMVAGKTPFSHAGVSEIFRDLLDAAATEPFMVSHNAAFDRTLLNRLLGTRPRDAASDPARWLCTLRLARHLLPDLPDYRLQYLRHALGLRVPRTMAPHRAGTDALICGHLLEALAAVAVELGRVNPAAGDLVGQLARLSQSPITITTWPMGNKHKGKPMAEVPTDYLEWAVMNIDALQENAVKFDPDLADAVIKEMTKRLEAA